VQNIAKEGVQNTNHQSGPTDDATAAMTTWSSWVCSLLRLVMRVLYTFLCSISYTLWSTGFKSGVWWNWRSQVKWN